MRNIKTDMFLLLYYLAIVLFDVWHIDLFFFKIYLFIQKERERQREKQAPCREPDMGLDPGSPGPRPGLKTALNR